MLNPHITIYPNYPTAVYVKGIAEPRAKVIQFAHGIVVLAGSIQDERLQPCILNRHNEIMYIVPNSYVESP